MTSLAIAAAGAAGLVSPPLPLRTGPWIGSADYPPVALRNGERGYVPIRILVSPEGAPAGCTAFTRSAVLKQLTCRLLMKRARFMPARDASGHAVPGEYRQLIAFKMENLSMPDRPTRADVILTVERLPATVHGPMVPIAFVVDPAGAVGACNAYDNHPTSDPLAAVACDHARGMPPEDIVTPGQTATTVRTLWVLFRDAGERGK